MAADVLGARALLNLPGHESTAAIVAEITRPSAEYPDITLVISDCSRVIHLSFDRGGTPDERENNLYKVDTLISVLREFRKGLVTMHRLQEKRG